MSFGTLLIQSPLELAILSVVPKEGKKSSTLTIKFSFDISFHPESNPKIPAYTHVCDMRNKKEDIMRTKTFFIRL